MSRSHRSTDLDKARDELMSHIVRCEVLEAAMEHRLEWLDDTMEYMADRWPSLSPLHIAQLAVIGREYLRPVIAYGAGHTALNRPQASTAASSAGGEAAPVEESRAA